MDTRTMLIELYETNWLKKQCMYITKNKYLTDWVMSEVMIKIIEKDDPLLLELYTNKRHFNYIYTMIKNEFIGEYSNTGKYINNKKEVEYIIKKYEDNEDEE